MDKSKVFIGCVSLFDIRFPEIKEIPKEVANYRKRLNSCYWSYEMPQNEIHNKNKIYKVTAKYEFEMIGTSKESVMSNLDVLMDSLVECHSNEIEDNDPDFYAEFTGKYPKKISCSVKLVNNKKL